MAILNEKIFYGKNYKITYKFRPARIDKRKLLVIFSGGFGKEKRYDFDGKSSEAIKCNVLWIKDEFKGEFTYYVRDRSGFQLSYEIQELIRSAISKLGINKNDVILAGFSKGGTAALYHGLRFDYKNIISTVPRIKIGTANVKRQSILDGITSDQSQAAIDALDRIIPSCIDDDINLDRNIYLYSSPQDPLYVNELKELVPKFDKYRNFNFVLTESDLVRRHRDVTRYNLPNIISIINLLIDNIEPSFGFCNNGNRDYRAIDLKSEDYGKSIFKNTLLRVSDDKLFIKGHSFFYGIEPSDEDISSVLELSNEKDFYQFNLAHMTDPYLSYNNYEHRYINYDRGGYTTFRNMGIDLSAIKSGDYKMQISTRQRGLENTNAIVANNLKTSWFASDSFLYCLSRNEDDSIVLSKNSLEISSSNQKYSMKVSASIVAGRLRVSGGLSFIGASSATNGGYYRYRLVLRNLDTNKAQLRPLRRIKESSTIELESLLEEYPNKCFGLNRKIDELFIPDGKFALEIALLAGNRLYMAPMRYNLIKNKSVSKLSKIK